jgi:hypothetical protein
MRIAQQPFRYLAVAIVALLVAGCGSGQVATYPSAGQVRFADGTPVRFAFVEFVPTAGGISSRAQVDEAGTFRLGTFAETDGCPAGRYRVVVTQHLPPNLAAAVGEHTSHTTIGIVAPLFTRPESTTLEVEVAAKPTNTFELVVEPART